MTHPLIALRRAQIAYDRVQSRWLAGRARTKQRDAAKNALRMAQEAAGASIGTVPARYIDGDQRWLDGLGRAATIHAAIDARTPQGNPTMRTEPYFIASPNALPATEDRCGIRKGDIIEIDPTMKPGVGDLYFTFGEYVNENRLEVCTGLVDPAMVRGVAISKRVMLRR